MPKKGSEPRRNAPPQESDFILLTGMSGAGRSTAAHVLEDEGWFVIDNIPPPLIPPLAELVARARENGEGAIRVAVVVDARAQRLTSELQVTLDHIRSAGWRPFMIFLDANDETLVRRFESVRRPHPLQGEGRLLDGIRSERELLGDLRAEAQVIVDTSGLNVHQMARKIAPLVGEDSGPALRVAVMSFGFKYGIPLDADYVFDLRFLPNPFWVPELRTFTGQDQQVASWVLDQEGAEEFLERAVALLASVRSGYLREGRRYITVAIGCTGGKHRSVAVAEELARRLSHDSVTTFVVHRDLGQE